MLNMPDIKGIRDKERRELKIVPGAWFFGEISLGTNSEMSSALQLAADKTEGSGEKSLNIILYARMGKDSPLEYGLDICNLVLLGGGLELNASGTYKPAFTCPNPSPQEGKQIDLIGTLTITDLRTPITFQVKYHSKSGKTEFGVTVDLASRPEIEEPYTGMFNMKLVQLGISAIIEEEKASKDEISGRVSLGDY